MSAVDENCLVARVQTLLQLERYSAARQECSAALASFPDSYILHCCAAQAQLGLDDLNGAEQTIRQAIILEPSHPYAYYLRSNIMKAALNFDEELKMAREAARLAPEDPDYLMGLAYAELQSGMAKAAKQTCQQLIQLDPNYSDALKLAGDIALALEDWQEAEQHYRAHLAQHAESAETINNLAIALAGRKQIKEATQLLFEAVKAHPGENIYQHNLFMFINHRLDRSLWRGGRGRVWQEMPATVKDFYAMYRRKVSIFERYSRFSMVVFWAIILLCLLQLARLLGAH